MQIPEIDFSGLAVSLTNDREIPRAVWKDIGDELVGGFTTSGFAIIKNHGISRTTLDEINKIADDFFTKPVEYKMKFTKDLSGLCYDPMDAVRANLKRPPDRNEGLRFPYRKCDEWPDIPKLKESVRDFQSKCKIIVMRILKCIGVGMRLKDVDLFWRSHILMGGEGNDTVLKFVRYPPLTTHPLLENQMRIAEHSDIGSLTLLFTDDIGGLQIQTSNGEFKDVTQINDAIVMNAGDMLDHWTRGKLKSTVHRVIAPTDPELKARVRRSVVFFGLPDASVVLREPLYENEQQNVGETKENLKVKDYKQILLRARIRPGNSE